ncbi:MAG: urate hydroxylase PuuD [Rhodospirillaceae bacterium]|nr:urate hydroxylase PuuD [Rhodospirillaceae bacterium]
MTAILSSLRNTILAGLVLAAAVFVVMGLVSPGYGLALNDAFWRFLARWAHVISAIMWVGMLFYFNFVQMPSMPKIPDERKAAVTKVIAPAALFWFRWAAMATVFFGIVLALLHGTDYFVNAVLLGIAGGGASITMIGIGMWLGAIMWFNVWFVIWPAQKTALGLVEASADEKKAAARRAMLVSRTNTALFFPMIYCMIGAQNPY